MKKILPIILIAICFISISGSFFFDERSEVRASSKYVVKQYDSWEEELEEMTGECVLPKEQQKEKTKTRKLFPTERHLKLIGRLAEGITSLKIKQKGWYECGILYEDVENIKSKALKYAYEIVRTSYVFKLNVWGLAGVIENESNFDRCALGLYPRKHAYQLGILERKKFCISHTEEEVLSVLDDPRMKKKFKRTGVDLGVGQVLSRFYDRPTDYRAMMQIDYGTMQAGQIMYNRSRWYGTKRPWLYWRGTKKEWYDAKVTKKARKLGATSKEI